MKLFSALGDCTLRRVCLACPGTLVAQEYLVQVQESRHPWPTRSLGLTGGTRPFSGRLQKHSALARAFPPWPLRFPRQLEWP